MTLAHSSQVAGRETVLIADQQITMTNNSYDYYDDCLLQRSESFEESPNHWGPINLYLTI